MTSKAAEPVPSVLNPQETLNVRHSSFLKSVRISLDTARDYLVVNGLVVPKMREALTCLSPQVDGPRRTAI